jgi:hypothetical protein
VIEGATPSTINDKLNALATEFEGSRQFVADTAREAAGYIKQLQAALEICRWELNEIEAPSPGVLEAIDTAEALLTLAAGSRRAKTAKPVECGASQSGPNEDSGNAPDNPA